MSQYSPSQVTSSHSEDSEDETHPKSSTSESAMHPGFSIPQRHITLDIQQSLSTFRNLKFGLSKKKTLIKPASFGDDDDEDNNTKQEYDTDINKKTKSPSKSRKEIELPVKPSPMYYSMYSNPSLIDINSLPKHRPSTVTGIDNFGFFTGVARPKVEQPKRDPRKSSDDEDTKTSKKIKEFLIKKNLSKVPDSWKCYKEKGIKIDELEYHMSEIEAELRKLTPNKKYKPLSKIQKEMYHVHSATYYRDDNRSYNGKLEFPLKDCKETKTKISDSKKGIKWSLNPKYATFGFYKRSEIYKENDEDWNKKVETFFESLLSKNLDLKQEVSKEKYPFRKWYSDINSSLGFESKPIEFDCQNKFWKIHPELFKKSLIKVLDNSTLDDTQDNGDFSINTTIDEKIEEEQEEILKLSPQSISKKSKKSKKKKKIKETSSEDDSVSEVDEKILIKKRKEEKKRLKELKNTVKEIVESTNKKRKRKRKHSDSSESSDDFNINFMQTILQLCESNNEAKKQKKNKKKKKYSDISPRIENSTLNKDDENSDDEAKVESTNDIIDVVKDHELSISNDLAPIEKSCDEKESIPRRRGPRTPSPPPPTKKRQGPRTPSPRPNEDGINENADCSNMDENECYYLEENDRDSHEKELTESRKKEFRGSLERDFRNSHEREYYRDSRERDFYRYSRSPSPKRYRNKSLSPSERYRNRSPSPSERYRKSRRKRGYYDSPHEFRDKRSPDFYRGSPSSVNYRSRRDDSYFRDKTLPDSTISDLDLIASQRKIPFLADQLYLSGKPPSPKRASLDERLEKEHGIKTDYSVPPPGYLPSGQRAVTPNFHSTHQINPGQYPSHFVQQTYTRPPPPTVFNSPYISEPPTTTVKNLEENKLLRVDNVIQILPETSEKPSISSLHINNEDKESKTSHDAVSTSGKLSTSEDSPTNILAKKVEEMKKKNKQLDEERRLKREKRLAERMQMDCKVSSETDIKPQLVGERILETIEKEEKQDSSLNKVEETKPTPSTLNHEEDPQAMTLQDMKNKKKKDKVRYISLKPLSRKERIRQERLIAMKKKKIIEENEERQEDDEEEEEEEFKPRSPVPLPDASTCKPILVKLGFSLTKKAKKSLTYADGVIPGKGSPDNSEDEEVVEANESDDSITSSSKLEQKPKRHKRIIVKIIRTRNIGDDPSSDEDDSPPPPPPPGSPTLWHTAEFIEKFGYNESNE